MGKVAVFCSASYDIDPVYNVLARDFVRRASAAGHEIVSGGTIKGTMGEIADELSLCGGYHIGIIPRFMEPLVHGALDEVVWTDTMSERKGLMRKGTDAVVALPGGIGTLDEVIETFTLRKLDRYRGKVLVLDCNGFYAPLKELLDHYVRTGMLDRDSRNLISFADSVDEILSMLED